MLKVLYGDIFQSKAEALVNPVNCVGVMGKGLALLFKRAYPDMFQEYAKICKHNQLFIGNLFTYETTTMNIIQDNTDLIKMRIKYNQPRYIINLPTKMHWKDKSNLFDISVGLKRLVREIGMLEIQSIAVPALGCGCGGLSFDQSLQVMLDCLSPVFETKREVYIYKPLPSI